MEGLQGDIKESRALVAKLREENSEQQTAIHGLNAQNNGLLYEVRRIGNEMQEILAERDLFKQDSEKLMAEIEHLKNNESGSRSAD